MARTNDLLSRINDRYSKLSKGQKVLATYISEQYDEAAFYTAAKLGETVGVSESTVVRFATALGYKGFPEFQRAMEEMVQDKLQSSEQVETIYENLQQSQILTSMLHSDISRLKETMDLIDEDTFELACDLILEAKTVYVVGLRNCRGLADFLSFYLTLVCDRVKQITTSSASEIFEQMVRVGKDDVVIGISFPRYSMRTLKALEFANHRSAKVITLTDRVHSPLNLYSSCNLIAPSKTSSIIDSLVAPMSVINALIIALSQKRKHKVIKTLEDLEQIWDDYQVYETDEIDVIDDSMKLRYHRPEG
ncbi:MAG: MurR/RpiR family transcriptional regulator [Lachnospiraceae bacterium]|nr:MurR/RpiR family transcriptional regulator [Lachnospiraceae bacterium]